MSTATERPRWMMLLLAPDPDAYHLTDLFAEVSPDNIWVKRGDFGLVPVRTMGKADAQMTELDIQGLPYMGSITVGPNDSPEIAELQSYMRSGRMLFGHDFLTVEAFGFPDLPLLKLWAGGGHGNCVLHSESAENAPGWIDLALERAQQQLVCATIENMYNTLFTGGRTSRFRVAGVNRDSHSRSTHHAIGALARTATQHYDLLDEPVKQMLEALFSIEEGHFYLDKNKLIKQ